MTEGNQEPRLKSTRTKKNITEENNTEENQKLRLMVMSDNLIYIVCFKSYYVNYLVKS